MKKLIIVFIFIFLIFDFSKQASFASNQTAIDSGISYLKTQLQTDGHIDGFSGVTDWAAQAFSANNLDLDTIASPSGQTILSFIKSDVLTNSSSSNDWSRRILTVTAINLNPYDFYGTNLVSGLEAYYNNNQIGNTSADNDDMFALLALLASKVDATSSIITDATTFVVSHQHSDGGFSYSTDGSTGSDIDDTAAAIMALKLAKNQGVNVSDLQSAIDNAKAYILANQNQDGGFAYDPNPSTSWDTTSNVSTTSWVVMALSSLGESGSKEFSSAINYIISTQQSDGSFPYQPAYPPGDTFDTSYAILALENSFWPLHTFSGTVPTVTTTPTQTPIPTTTPTPTPTPSQSTSNNADTPTPTPTTTPNPTPTLIPTIAPLLQQNTTLLNQNINPSPTESFALTTSPTTGVLGVNTSKTKQNSNYFLLISLAFFVLGGGFLIFHFFKFYKTN